MQPGKKKVQKLLFKPCPPCYTFGRGERAVRRFFRKGGSAVEHIVCRTCGPAETEALGERLAPRLALAPAVALFGGLGMGKTAFVRGLARGLGCAGPVTSPTYTIVNEYPGKRKLCHFDIYRLESAEDLYDIGWEDYLASGALCVTEWSEKAEEAFPPGTAEVRFSRIDDETREIQVTVW